MMFYSLVIPCFVVDGRNVNPQVGIFGCRIFALVTRKFPLLLGVAVPLVPIQQRHPDRRIVAQVAPESEDVFSYELGK